MMSLNGTFIDCTAIVIGTVLGAAARSRIVNSPLADRMTQSLALCAFLVGITGSLDVSNPLTAIVSFVIGGLIGDILDLERRLVWLLNKSAALLSSTSLSEKSIEGLISYTLLSIVGSLSVVGALENGLTGDITKLMTKSLLDLICAVMFGASFGLSVMLSAIVVLLYQGFFASLALILSPVITEAVLGDMSAIGSVLIFCTGLNLLGVCRFKTMNMLPALFLPILLGLFF